MPSSYVVLAAKNHSDLALGRMPQLDALRALAALAVIGSHATSYRGHTVGAYGVTLFFVLSGFLITGILLQCRDRAQQGGSKRRWLLRQFYIRRFLRIFPLYYFVLAVLLIAGYSPVREGAVWFFGYMSDFYLGHPGVSESAVSHFWSLAVEEQFYLVWPWLVLCLPARALPWFTLAMTAASPTYRVVGSIIGMSEPALWVSPFASLDALGIGSLLAITWKEKRSLALHRACLLLGVVLILSLAICRLKFPVLSLSLWTLGPAMLSAWLVSATAKGFTGIVGGIASSRPILWVGTISYGVYVYHLPVLMLVRRYVYRDSDVLCFMIVTCLTICIAALSWYGFERPINNLKRCFPYSTPHPQAVLAAPEVSRL